MSSLFASHVRRDLTALVLSLTGALLTACADDVVVDSASGSGTSTGNASTGNGSSGNGSSSGSNGSSSGGNGGSGGVGGGTSTGTGMSDCNELGAVLESAVNNALSCNPVLSVPQCSGKTVVRDSCGCELAANDTTPLAADAANSAYATWSAHGCGPIPCLLCPPPPSAEPWFCDPNTSQCNVSF